MLMSSLGLVTGAKDMEVFREEKISLGIPFLLLSCLTYGALTLREILSVLMG